MGWERFLGLEHVIIRTTLFFRVTSFQEKFYKYTPIFEYNKLGNDI